MKHFSLLNCFRPITVQCLFGLLTVGYSTYTNTWAGRVVCLVVAVWSAVNVAGTRLRDIAPKVGMDDDPENWQKVHKDVINRCA